MTPGLPVSPHAEHPVPCHLSIALLHPTASESGLQHQGDLIVLDALPEADQGTEGFRIP